MHRAQEILYQGLQTQAAAVARSCALWTCASGTHSWHTESHKGKAEGKEVEGLLRRFIVDSKSCRLETEALRRREGSMDRVLHTTRILRFCWYSQRGKVALVRVAKANMGYDPKKRFTCIVDLKNQKKKEPCNRGIKESRNQEIKKSRNRGIKESRNQRIKESTNQGIKEPKNQGIKESENEGIKESRNQRIEESTNQGIKEPKNQGINESRNHGIKELRNQRIKESRNQRIKESKNQVINESKNQRIKEQKNQGIMVSRNWGVKDSRNP
ncbi:hypothetical protein PV328_000845 [Microctonus aethiopoides]|uniref:Uncharacterized protein n=1 Tax=Microctonus aethiopoides TaxID=144406 RepID=A0AA39KWP0_9HYME|nr:hypothetical protein PV328_000845 [Microctonus aethiopoides]